MATLMTPALTSTSTVSATHVVVDFLSADTILSRSSFPQFAYYYILPLQRVGVCRRGLQSLLFGLEGSEGT